MSQMHVNGVRFFGMEKLHLDSFTAQEMQRVCARCVERIRERIGDMLEVTVRFSVRRFPDDMERYTVRVDIAYSGGNVSAASEDWYLTNAIKDSFGMVESQVESASMQF